MDVLESSPLGIMTLTALVASVVFLILWLYLVISRRRGFPLLALTVVILALGGFSLQRYLRGLSSHNLQSIRLPPGYEMVHQPGEDTYIGRISKPGGLDIRIDIGALSGLWANPTEPDKHIWVFEQTIRDHRVFIGLRPYGEQANGKLLCVTFPRGVVNFFAEVHSEREIAEMLSIVLAYEPGV